MKIRPADGSSRRILVSIPDGDYAVHMVTLSDVESGHQFPIAHYLLAVGPSRCQLSSDYPTREALVAAWTVNGIEMPTDRASLSGRIVKAMLEAGSVEEVR